MAFPVAVEVLTHSQGDGCVLSQKLMPFLVQERNGLFKPENVVFLKALGKLDGLGKTQDGVGIDEDLGLFA